MEEDWRTKNPPKENRTPKCCLLLHMSVSFLCPDPCISRAKQSQVPMRPVYVNSLSTSRVGLCGSLGWDTAVGSGIVGGSCAQRCLKAGDCRSRGNVLAWSRRSCSCRFCSSGCSLGTAAWPRWAWMPTFMQAARQRIVLRKLWHITLRVSSHLPSPCPWPNVTRGSRVS